MPAEPLAADPSRAALVLVDLQKSLVAATMGGAQVLSRAETVARAARALGVPILATVHVPDKLGPLYPSLEAFAPEPIAKSAFSCLGSPEFRAALEATGRDQVALVGFEAHICVALTARDLLREGKAPTVLADAVASRTEDRYELALSELRHAGVSVRHSESLLYEWMGTAENPAFREVLAAVKASRY